MCCKLMHDAVAVPHKLLPPTKKSCMKPCTCLDTIVRLDRESVRNELTEREEFYDEDENLSDTDSEDEWVCK